jgi:hypothetical protein
MGAHSTDILWRRSKAGAASGADDVQAALRDALGEAEPWRDIGTVQRKQAEARVSFELTATSLRKVHGETHIDDVSLTLRHAAVSTSFLGPTLSGKTKLMRLMAA